MRKHILNRILLLIFIVMFTCLAIFGAVKKNTYTDVMSEENAMDKFMVGQLPTEIVEGLCDLYREELPKQPIILKVSVISGPEFLARTYRYKVRVEKIFKGENINEGDTFYINDLGWAAYFTQDMLDDGLPYTLDMGFINFMLEDEEYLVFLKDKIATLDGAEVYSFEGYSLVPVFSYSETNSIPMEPEIGGTTYVSYSKVKENEFFACEQEGLDKLYELKNYLIGIYN